MLRSEEERVRRIVMEELLAAGWTPPPDPGTGKRLISTRIDPADVPLMPYPPTLQAAAEQARREYFAGVNDAARAEIVKLVRAELASVLRDLVAASYEQNQWDHDVVKGTFHAELRQVLEAVARTREQTETEEGSEHG